MTMNKILVAFVTIVAVVPLCFADNTTVPMPVLNGTVSPVEDTTTFTGRVNAISSAYIMNGARRQINVKDDVGQETIFVVANDTVITGKDGKPTTLNWISQTDTVSLEYITDEFGSKIVRSIKVLPGW
jgi:hypothetical protein